MSDFNYKKYSLEQLDNWVHDAIGCGEASPQEVYDTIKNAVEEEYHIYKDRTSKCYELLALLNGNGKHYDQYIKKEEETLICDQNNPSEECQNAWNDFWEEHYYPEEAKDVANSKKDKVKRWVLPVEMDSNNEDMYLTLPDDLLSAIGWKEGEELEWIDHDGYLELRKVNQ